MVAFTAIANLSASNHANNIKVHKDSISASEAQLSGCKALILKTRKKLQDKQKKLKDTIQEVKNQLAAEAAGNILKAIFQIGVAFATAGTGSDPMTGAEKLELAAKMIDLIIKLAKLLNDLIGGIIDTDEFRNIVNFKNRDAPLPADFLKAIQEADKMRDAKDLFEAIDSEGEAMYNELREASDWADTKSLKVAIDAVVIQGRKLVSEVILYFISKVR